MPLIVNRDKCTLCGYCAEICPVDVLKLVVENNCKTLVVRYPEECWHCRACVNDCPASALSMRYPLSHMLLTMEPDKAGK
jgi:adenylylsulfate reductase subunit B